MKYGCKYKFVEIYTPKLLGSIEMCPNIKKKKKTSVLSTLAIAALFGHPCIVLTSIHTRGRYDKICSALFLPQIAIINSVLYMS